MADSRICDFSVDEVQGLTVSKLKAELTRLNVPVVNIKRKAQLIEALTVSLSHTGLMVFANRSRKTGNLISAKLVRMCWLALLTSN